MWYNNSRSWIKRCLQTRVRRRYRRLSGRKNRPLTVAEAASRDKAEIENSAKGGPIAMADDTICNEESMESLRDQVLKVIKSYK